MLLNINRDTNFLSLNHAQVIEFIGILAFFIISPMLSFPIILIGAYNQRRYSYILISIFLGLISMYYYPQGDQFRYLEDFNRYRGMRFSDVFDFNTLIAYRNFNIITLSLFGASKISWMNLEIYRMILVSLSSWICISIFNKIIAEKIYSVTRTIRFKLLLLVILSIPIYYISQGFRSGLGAVFLSLGVIELIGKKKSGYFFLAIASFIHFSYIPISILFIVGILTKYRITNKNFVYCLLFILATIIILISLLYTSVPFINMMLNIYLFGSYGTDFVWDAYRIKEVVLINGLPTLIFYILYIRSKKDICFKFSNVIYLNLALVLLCLPFQAFTQRLGVISVLLLVFYSVKNYRNMHIVKYFQILLVSLMVSVTFPFIMHRYYYKYAHLENIFIYPLPMILQNTYDLREIYFMLDKDGILKSQYIN